MQNNSNDNIQNWKQRLDDFEDIAGNNLDRNDAWDKLQQKKAVTKTPNKKIWYWLAAACVAGLSAFIINSIYEQPGKTTTPDIVKTTNTDPVKENNITVIKNEPVAIENVKEKKQEINEDPSPVNPGVIEKDNIAEEPLLVKDQPALPQQMIALTDTISRPSLPVIAKNKKLKVVHINELNQNNNGFAQQEGKPYFPITYQTKQVYTNAADNNNKTGKDNLIRIKLFP